MYGKQNNKNMEIVEFLATISENPELLKKMMDLTKEEKNKSSIKSKGKAKRPVTEEEYNNIIKLIATGFEYIENGKKKISLPNMKVALALTIEANTGLRISDVIKLKVEHFQKGMIEMHEKKTNKLQYRKMSTALISVVNKYIIMNGLKMEDIIIDCSERNIQIILKRATDYLHIENIGTHSFRKYFSMYVFNETKDIRLLQALLNHSDIGTTQRYLTVDQSRLNEISSSIDFTGPLNNL